MRRAVGEGLWAKGCGRRERKRRTDTATAEVVMQCTFKLCLRETIGGLLESLLLWQFLSPLSFLEGGFVAGDVAVGVS